MRPWWTESILSAQELAGSLLTTAHKNLGGHTESRGKIMSFSKSPVGSSKAGRRSYLTGQVHREWPLEESPMISALFKLFFFYLYNEKLVLHSKWSYKEQSCNHWKNDRRLYYVKVLKLEVILNHTWIEGGVSITLSAAIGSKKKMISFSYSIKA